MRIALLLLLLMFISCKYKSAICDSELEKLELIYMLDVHTQTPVPCDMFTLSTTFVDEKQYLVISDKKILKDLLSQICSFEEKKNDFEDLTKRTFINTRVSGVLFFKNGTQSQMCVGHGAFEYNGVLMNTNENFLRTLKSLLVK